MSAMPEYVVRSLGPPTWPAFEDLAMRNNGVWGSCWCTWFHTFTKDKERDAEANRALKYRLVHEGRAHAALVFDGDSAVAWCEYGTPDELPNIYHRKEYLASTDELPDYRITCFFVESGHRRQGVSAIALAGALELIAVAGGGRVEGYPHDIAGKRMSASFLYNGTRTLFENAGFSYVRPKGKSNCVMSITVASAKPTRRRPGARTRAAMSSRSDATDDDHNCESSSGGLASALDRRPEGT